ncbi:MAG: NIPSNAP family protein [Alphaproteobacteria bacterium]
MIIEHRVYTMKPGNLDAFVDAQVERGFDSVAPIMGNCAGYFATIAGPVTQMLHLWVFDDLEDWRNRYNQLYTNDTLQPYFSTVRPLMLAQEVTMLAPAPLDALTPLWSAGEPAERDWRPGSGPVGDLGSAPDTIVEAETLSLVPGGLPAYWEACEASGIEAQRPLADNLLGTFFTLIGPLHEVTRLWRFKSLAERDAKHQAAAASAAGREHFRTIRPLSTGIRTRLARPVRVAEMSPLFTMG